MYWDNKVEYYMSVLYKRYKRGKITNAKYKRLQATLLFWGFHFYYEAGGSREEEDEDGY